MTPREAAERIESALQVRVHNGAEDGEFKPTLVDVAEKIIQEAIDEAVKLEPTDTRVVRIAEALAEGCDGRSFASEDAKTLARRYEALRYSDPSLGFSGCRVKVYCDFIVEILTSGPIPKPVDLSSERQSS